MSLKYHDGVVKLLGLSPTISPHAISRMDRWQQQTGRIIPESVREWFALAESKGALGCADGEYFVAELENFLAHFSEVTEENPQVTFVGPGAVNTGYEAWIVLAGDTTDPIVEEFISPPRDLAFSDYVKDTAWQHRIRDGFIGESSRLAGDVTYCDLSILGCLRKNYEELIIPDESSLNSREFRFYRDGVRLHISARADPELQSCSAHYQLAADSFDQLMDLYEEIRPLHGRAFILSDIEHHNMELLRQTFTKRFPDTHVSIRHW